MQKIIRQIAAELRVQEQQVRAAVDLLDGGATVPFVARYRKEATGGLDDIQLRELEFRLGYLRELEERREAVLKSIDEQGKLTPALRAAIEAAPTKQELEDLYLPYKPRRRTKGQIAREAGLEPLADRLYADPALVPALEAEAFVKAEKGEGGEDFTTVAAVLDGVRDILSERWAEDAVLVQGLREWLWAEGLLRSRLASGKDENHPDVAKFRDYFDYDEPIGRVPSHRALAVFRGRTLELLDAKLVLPVEPELGQPSLAEGRIALHLGWSHAGRPGDDLIRKCVAWTWRVKLSLSIERDLFTRLREEAEKVAIKVFADNLRDLLLAAPAGPRVVMGLDPGIRTGVKVAVVDSTGKLVDTATVYPHEPRRDWEGALHTLALLARKHGVNLIAIGNGTASRETDKLAADLMKRLASAQGESGAGGLQRVVVSESGASVYSASEFASQEMPDVDVSLRGAASIARRLQDPLAELVKIDPKSIGVGQYQHDVNQSELARTLDAVVEDCVNAVGVDLNTASVPLLARVSGLSGSVAKAVVRWREAHGAFRSRQQLLEVSGLGPKTFEQSAGFLRIRGGDNPLDMTGVHPETYPVVEGILAKTGKPVAELMGRADMLKTLRPELFANERFGVITVRDILAELEKPGRDPRPDFKVARFSDGVQDIADLKPGMELEGTVSNVAAFGAFVDLGVHQDGLVHVSQLAHKFVKDAREVVKTGDIVKVKVLEVDAARKRISLTLKLGEAPRTSGGPRENRYEAPGRGPQPRREQQALPTTMAGAFAKLQGLRKTSMSPSPALRLYAGPEARRHIEQHGLRPQDVGVIPAAAGGPKGLVLGPLDRFIFGQWLPRSQQPVHLVGASIGAWRMATACLDDPVSAFERLERDYISQDYELAPGRKTPTAAHVSERFGENLRSFYGGRIGEVLGHERYRLHIVTSRGRHVLGREHKLRTPLGYLGAFLSNSLHRKAMGAWLERVVFSSPGAEAPASLPFGTGDYRTRQVALSEANFQPALQASCSIPFVLKAIHDIPGAPPGAYWDGGITDYHLHLNYKPDAAAGIVLYPHFQKSVVPGWLDKGLKWRHRATGFLDRIVVLAPDPEWVRKLPNAKLPDRNDFPRYGTDLQARMKAWATATAASRQLADEFAQWLDKPRLDRIDAL